MPANTPSPGGGEPTRQEQKTHQAKTEEEYNVFRDSLVRYMGYANEVGESFRYQFPRFVVPSYAISFGYCLADALTSGKKAYDSAKKDNLPTAAVDSIVSTADTLLWQSLASVCIPGLAINQIVKASRFAVARSPAGVPVAITTWLPTCLGLGSIPLIIHPIDDFVDVVMDNSFRKVQWNSYFL
jgi:fission process protein 1